MIDFQGFSPESFQELVGSLSLQVFGQGATIHGRGPDGGRDITFRGRVNYPNTGAHSWDGYGVVQVKFKSTRESTQADQAWAERQLKQELKQWLSESKRTFKPEYFVFATNIELTAASGGGRDRMEELLRNHSTTLGLKDFSIWDANQLRMLIGNHPVVRERYTAFFTTGDMLAALVRHAIPGADADAILTNFLRSGLIADDAARLGQAGHRSDERMRLSQLFVDLPHSEGRSPTAASHQTIKSLTAPLCLRTLNTIAQQKLDPKTLYEQNQACGRFLLIGGPGSGKSTIGQFLSQMHRAALLDRRPPYRLDAQARTIISNLKNRCADDLADWPATPRFPIRVELSMFAKALDPADPGLAVRTFSEYLRLQLSSNTRITHEMFREWLRASRWLLVLDGLDEVPAASNRGSVIAALRDFLAEARDLEADLLVIASTRPEGYEGELDDAEMRILTLSPLSAATARQCAERYIAARIGPDDPSRAREAVATLIDAIRNPLTARLMTSPLQVTFMTTVITVSGKPSESRWLLFSDYFRIIYDRELQKAVPPFNRVLSKRRPAIEALHQKVGFLLQHRAEHAGETQADLGFEEFERLVDSMLSEDGLVGDELIRERREIVDAAKLRLVFLTSRTVTRLSFEVRSLQEYMAAAYLTNGDIAPIVQRLETIAHSAYWRNTLLFAIGRFFDDVSFRDHRGHIRLLCEDLNRKDEVRSSVRLGSRLALDILENGGATAVPLVSRSLAACALQLLELRGGDRADLPRRLSNIHENVMEPEFRRALVALFGLKRFSDAIGAWLVLLFLEQRQIQWASELASRHWPKDVEQAKLVVEAWQQADSHAIWEGQLDAPLASRIESLLGQLPVRECWYLISPPLSQWSINSNTDDIDLTSLVRVLSDPVTYTSGLKISGVNSITVHINPIEWLTESADQICNMLVEQRLQADWPSYVPVFEFMRTPNAATLSAALRCFAAFDQPTCLDPWLWIVPWPLAIYLAVRPSNEWLEEKSRTIGQDIGDVEQWLEIEQQWRESGLTKTQFLTPTYPGLAAPCEAFRHVFLSSKLSHQDLRMFEILSERLRHSPNASIARLLEQVLNSSSDPQAVLTPEWILRQAQTPGIGPVNHVGADPLVIEQNPAAWLQLYDWIGRQPQLRAMSNIWALRDSLSPSTLLRGFEADPSQLGLLRLAAFWSLRDYRPDPSTLQSLQSLQREPDYEWARNLLLLLDPELSATQVANIGRRLAAIIPETCMPMRSLEAILLAITRHIQAVPQLHAALLPLDRLTTLPGYERFAADIEQLHYLTLRSQPSGLDEARLRALKLSVH